MADALEDEINRWLLWAKREGRSVDDMFSQVESDYMEGIGGIDWAESVLAGFAAVLSLSPGHQRATHFRSAMQRSLVIGQAVRRPISNGRFEIRNRRLEGQH